MSKYTEELKKQIVLEHKIKHYGASSTAIVIMPVIWDLVPS